MSRNIYVLAVAFTIGAFIGIGVWSYFTLSEVKTIAQEVEQAYANNPINHIRALIQGAETVNRKATAEFQTKAREMILSAKSIERLIISVFASGLLAVSGLVLLDMLVIEPTIDIAKRSAQSLRTKIQVWRFNRAKRALERNLAQIEAMRNIQQ